MKMLPYTNNGDCVKTFFVITGLPRKRV